MALSNITKAELEADGSISTRVKGWDVWVEQVGRRYYFSIFNCYEEDSDAAVMVLNRAYSYTITDVKAEIMQVINDQPLTAAEAVKLAVKHDAGHITIEDLEARAKEDTEDLIRAQLSRVNLSGLCLADLKLLAKATEKGPVFLGVTLAGAYNITAEVPPILQEQNA